MPTNRNALLRFVRIDQALKDRNHYYTFDKLLDFVKNGLDFHVSSRQLYEDLRFLQYERPFYAKIEKVMRSGHKVYRYADPDYSIFSSYILPPDALSNRAKEVIERYVNETGKKHGPTLPYFGLMLALFDYSGRTKGFYEPDDDFHLSNVLSQKEIAMLMNEYVAVINHIGDLLPKNIYDLWQGLTDIKAEERVALFWEKDDESFYEKAALIDARGAEIDRYEALPTSGDGEHAPKYDYVFVAARPRHRGHNLSERFDSLPWIAANMLREGGRLFIVAPFGFLNAMSASEARGQIIHSARKHSVLVVTEPAFTSLQKGRELCLVCVTNDGKGEITLADCNSIEFTNARDSDKKGDCSLNMVRIVDTLKHTDEQYVWRGTADDLLPRCSLLPSRYLLQPLFKIKQHPGTKIVELRDIISTTATYRRVKGAGDFPYISAKMLSADSLACDIDVSQITDREKADKYLLKSDCLLALYDRGGVYVGRTHGISDDNTVALFPLAIPFTLKSDRITEEFLLSELTSKMVRQQLGFIRAPGMWPTRLRFADFLSIRIVIPPLEVQNRRCERNRRTKQAIREARQKNNAPTDPPQEKLQQNPDSRQREL